MNPFLPCERCDHSRTCRYKEEYEIFLDETLKELFDLMPDFLDVYIRCKFFSEDWDDYYDYV